MGTETGVRFPADWRVGFKHTDETKRLLSEMRRGDRNPFFGRKHTRESLAKIAASRPAKSAKTGAFTASRPTVTIPSDPVKLAYVAGLIDGEGSVGIRKTGTPYVTIYNTHLGVMHWLWGTLGGTFSAVDNRGRVMCYAWRVQSLRNSQALIRAVLPFLIIKRESAARTLAELDLRLGGTNG
jgi:NUMOD3 motif